MFTTSLNINVCIFFLLYYQQVTFNTLLIDVCFCFSLNPVVSLKPLCKWKNFLMMKFNSFCHLVHYRSRGGWNTRQHSHWQHNSDQQWDRLLSVWERVHLPGLHVWHAAWTIIRLELEPDHRDIQAFQLFRPGHRSHTGNRGRFAVY